MHRIPQTASISHSQAVHVTGKDRPNTKARPTQQSKAVFARDGSQWPQVPLDLGSCSFKFIQTSVLTIHAIGNATGKVTSDSKIKQSTGNAAATASDICLSCSIILGGLLHLSNYKELLPHAPHTTNCKHLSQSIKKNELW